MKLHRFAACIVALLIAAPVVRSAEELFARDNLVAWCIVPFDAKKRGPEERAAMLEKLGFKHFAYDWRGEHIPTFDAEIDALKKHNIELSAWWFPGSLNKDAQSILNVLEKHSIKTQLWISCSGGAAPKDDAERAKRIAAEVARLKPIAEAAAKIGCEVDLYNHGGWGAEPEQMAAVAEDMKALNVGIIYNLHHGHEHLDRLPEALKKMLPYLRVVNINGMKKDGDKKGEKILVVGTGDLDLSLLKTIRDSGFKGRIGILNHTNEDAETRLKANVDGLEKLTAQLNTK
ncbi:MAG: TIM barrel protein [Planctomycetota bacterium]